MRRAPMVLISMPDPAELRVSERLSQATTEAEVDAAVAEMLEWDLPYPWLRENLPNSGERRKREIRGEEEVEEIVLP